MVVQGRYVEHQTVRDGTRRVLVGSVWTKGPHTETWSVEMVNVMDSDVSFRKGCYVVQDSECFVSAGDGLLINLHCVIERVRCFKAGDTDRPPS